MAANGHILRPRAACGWHSSSSRPVSCDSHRIRSRGSSAGGRGLPRPACAVGHGRMGGRTGCACRFSTTTVACDSDFLRSCSVGRLKDSCQRLHWKRIGVCRGSGRRVFGGDSHRCDGHGHTRRRPPAFHRNGSCRGGPRPFVLPAGSIHLTHRLSNKFPSRICRAVFGLFHRDFADSNQRGAHGRGSGVQSGLFGFIPRSALSSAHWGSTRRFNNFRCFSDASFRLWKQPCGVFVRNHLPACPALTACGCVPRARCVLESGGGDPRGGGNRFPRSAGYPVCLNPARGVGSRGCVPRLRGRGDVHSSILFCPFLARRTTGISRYRYETDATTRVMKNMPRLHKNGRRVGPIANLAKWDSKYHSRIR